MTTVPYPTPTDFENLGIILNRLADARADLGDVLRSVLGDDMGLCRDAAAYRQRAADPQKFFAFTRARQGFSGQVLPPHRPPPQQPGSPGGVYGPMIVSQAHTATAAADCCEAARDAHVLAGLALRDLETWFAKHGLSGAVFLQKARMEEWEAQNLDAWVKRLRLPAATHQGSGGPHL